jgi:hypothetical protein
VRGSTGPVEMNVYSAKRASYPRLVPAQDSEVVVREVGQVETFATAVEAAKAVPEVLSDEPAWCHEIRIERISHVPMSSKPPMPEPALWVLVHRELGPLTTYRTQADALGDLMRVFDDNPSWAGEIWVEPFEDSVHAEQRGA